MRPASSSPSGWRARPSLAPAGWGRMRCAICRGPLYVGVWRPGPQNGPARAPERNARGVPHALREPILFPIGAAPRRCAQAFQAPRRCARGQTPSTLAVTASRRHLRGVKRVVSILFFTLCVIVGLVRPASAEDPVLGVRAVVEPARVGVGDRALLRVDVEIPSGWHLWSMDPGEG